MWKLWKMWKENGRITKSPKNVAFRCRSFRKLSREKSVKNVHNVNKFVKKPAFFQHFPEIREFSGLRKFCEQLPASQIPGFVLYSVRE